MVKWTLDNAGPSKGDRLCFSAEADAPGTPKRWWSHTPRVLLHGNSCGTDCTAVGELELVSLLLLRKFNSGKSFISGWIPILTSS